MEIGEGQVEPLEVHRTWYLAPAPVAVCPRGSFELPGAVEKTMVDVAPVGEEGAGAEGEGGCRFHLDVQDMLLMSRREIDERAAELEGRGDIDSLRGLDLVVEEFRLTDRRGAPFDLSAADSVTVLVDGQVFLDRLELERIQAGEQVQVTLSQEFVDRFVRVLKHRADLRIDLTVRLVTHLSKQPLPPTLRLRAVLQPVLLVDALAAVL